MEKRISQPSSPAARCSAGHELRLLLCYKAAAHGLPLLPILCRVPGLRVAWTSHPMDGSTAEPLDSAHTSAFGPLVRGFSPKEMKNSRSVIEVCGERGLPGTGTSWPWPPTPAGADRALQGPAPAHQSCIDLQAAFCNSEHKGKGWEPTERSGSVGVVPQRDTSPGTRGCAAGPGGMGAAPPC